VIVLRAFLFGLNHALFTSLTGIGFGIARHTPKPFWRFAAPLLGLTTAMIAHGIHNTCTGLTEEFALAFCFAILSDWSGVIIILVIMILAIRRERQWMIDQLQEEVAHKTLNEAQYEIACSPVSRFGTRLSALLSGGISRWWQVGRYFHTLTELAYKKHAYARRGPEGAEPELINALRNQVTTLSSELDDLS
jgi:hypothetical protein